MFISSAPGYSLDNLKPKPLVLACYSFSDKATLLILARSIGLSWGHDMACGFDELLTPSCQPKKPNIQAEDIHNTVNPASCGKTFNSLTVDHPLSWASALPVEC